MLDVSDQSNPGKTGAGSLLWHDRRRASYTAMTRATDCLYLYHPADLGNGNRWKLNRFLSPDAPPEGQKPGAEPLLPDKAADPNTNSARGTYAYVL